MILVLVFGFDVGFVFVRRLVLAFQFPWAFVAQVYLFGGFCGLGFLVLWF